GRADLRRLRPALACCTRTGGAKALDRPGAARQRLRPGQGDPPSPPPARPQRRGARFAPARRVRRPARRRAATDAGKGRFGATAYPWFPAPAAAPGSAEVPRAGAFTAAPPGRGPAVRPLRVVRRDLA